MQPATPAVASPGNPALPGQPVAPPSGNNAAASTPPANTSQPLLYQACRDGDTTVVKRLLAAGGIDVNAIDPHTRLAPLMLAAQHGHDDVALVLMKGQQGANVNLQNSRGDSALSLAAGAGREDVAMLLLERKADPGQTGHCGRTPLAEAVAGGQLRMAGLLLERGAQVDGSREGGKPPLTIAARRGDSALAALLLEHKASPDLADRHGWTAFHHASAMGHAALAGQLRGSGAAPAPQPKAASQQEATEHGAVEGKGNRQAAQGVVPGGASTVTTTATAATAATLANATTASTTAMATTVATATTATATATTVTSIVATQPAYVAPAAPAMPATPVGPAMESPTALCKAVERNDVETLHQIVTAHPGQRAVLHQPIAFTRQRGPLPAGSYTLLMLAAAHGHVAMVEALLALGAEVNARGSADRTALILAVDNRRLDVAEILLKAGAEVDAQAADGSTAVMLALARRDAAAVRALLAGVSDPEDISSCLCQAAASGHVNTARLLLKAGAKVDGSHAVSALMSEVMKKGDIETVFILLAARYSPQWRDHEKAFPELGELMSWAICTKRPALLRDLLASRAGKAAVEIIPRPLRNAIEADQPDILRMLLGAGVNFNKHKNNQQHPLVSAAYSAGAEVVAVLLDAGASFAEACRSSGYSPLSVAAINNSADVVKLFLKPALKAPDARKLLDTALWDACAIASHLGERAEIAQMLLDAGAEFNDHYGGDIHRLLYRILEDHHAEQLPEGASEDASVPRGRAAVVQLLLKHKADVNHDPGKESAYPSPLFAAVWTGKTAIVRVLLEAGAKTDLKDKDGRTALQHAVKNEYREIEALLRNGGPKTA